jgi:hypothetical protein
MTKKKTTSQTEKFPKDINSQGMMPKTSARYQGWIM